MTEPAAHGEAAGLQAKDNGSSVRAARIYSSQGRNPSGSPRSPIDWQPYPAPYYWQNRGRAGHSGIMGTFIEPLPSSHCDLNLLLFK
jgi:hypothetical protein